MKEGFCIVKIAIGAAIAWAVFEFLNGVKRAWKGE